MSPPTGETLVFPPSEEEYAVRIALRCGYCAIVAQGIRSIDPHGKITESVEWLRENVSAGATTPFSQEKTVNTLAAWSLLKLQEGLIIGDSTVLRSHDVFDEANAPLARLRDAAAVCGLYDIQNDELSTAALQATPHIYDLNKSVARISSPSPVEVALSSLWGCSAPGAFLDEFRKLSRLSRARGKMPSPCIDPEDTKVLLAAYKKQVPEGVTSQGSLVFNAEEILGRKPRVITRQLSTYRVLAAQARFDELHKMLVEDMYAMVGPTAPRES